MKKADPAAKPTSVSARITEPIDRLGYKSWPLSGNPLLSAVIESSALREKYHRAALSLEFSCP